MKEKLSLNRIFNNYKPYYDKINPLIVKVISNSKTVSSDKNIVTLLQSSKKIRSLFYFLLIKCNEKQIKEEDIYKAVAIEILHASSLIHDDFIDEATSRRGLISINQRFGNRFSALLGDRLSLMSVELMYKNCDKETFREFLQLTKTMSKGQYKEQYDSFELDTDLKRYIDIIKGKTADFFTFIAKLSNSKPLDLYLKISYEFGLIFQLTDDLIDISSNNSGKEPFNDFKNGKISFPIILLKKKMNKEALKDIFASKEKFNKKIVEFNIKELSLEIINKRVEKCNIYISQLKSNKHLENLKLLLDFLVKRNY